MNFLTLWPYLLLIPALALGGLLGWQLRAARERKAPPEKELVPVNPLDGLVQTRLETLDEARAELSRLENQINTVHQNIRDATESYESLQGEYRQLILNLDRRRTAVENAQTQADVRESLQLTQKEEVLADVDASGAELEELQHLNSRYETRINRLAQQVERQDSELQMLRQLAKTRTTEIEEQQRLIAQTESELRQLIRQRQQREADLEKVRQQLAEVNEELRRLIEHQDRSDIFERMPPSEDILSRHRRKDVTPRLRPGLPSGGTLKDEAGDSS